jgi:hypothetical protein
MSPEVARLLGGYATNTLTADERQLLYQAALEDQELFNVLEDEQALRDLLADDRSRKEIGHALRPVPAKPRRWWIWGLATATVCAAIIFGLVLNRPQPKMITPQMAIVRTPPASVAATPEMSALRAKTAAASASPIAAVSLSLDQRKGLLPFVILRVRSNAAPAELKPADRIQAGDQILFRLRPDLPGALAVSELVRDRAPKTLLADIPIKVDGPKNIRVEWTSSSMAAPRVTYLNLSPGQPVQQL